MNNIDVHADDYALSIETSKDILKCMKEGKITGISIIPNMECFGECMRMLYDEISELPFLPLMSVHINLVEGKSVSSSSDIKGFVKDGVIIGNWSKYYLMSLWLKDEVIVKAIEYEIEQQIDLCQKEILKCIKKANEYGVKCQQKGIRLDSHQHTHMIPVIWNSIMTISARRKYNVEYIRNSYEPIGVFLGESKLIKTYSIINIIKNIILATNSKKVDAFCEQKGINKMYLWGLIMSGNMDYLRVQMLYDKVVMCSVKDGRDLEILFHPGKVGTEEMSDELNARSIREFYTSVGREKELYTLFKLF